MRTSEQFPVQTISAAGLSEEIRSLCAKQRYWVTGECKNPRPSKHRSWTFDLLTKDVDSGKVVYTSCWISAKNATIINAFLTRRGPSLAEALIDGMELMVDAEPQIWQNTLQLTVTRIREGFLPTGVFQRGLVEDLASLMIEHPDHSRFGAPRSTVHWRANNGLPFSVGRLERLTVIGPERSQGRNDLQHELGNRLNKALHITHQSINWHQEDAGSRFRQIVRDAKDDGHTLVVLLRGGGHWSGMQAFESRKVAELIICAELPIVTAVGHADDVSLADRAARASFVTPTAVANAINGTFNDQKTQDRFARNRQARTQTQKNMPQSEQRILDLEADLATSKNDAVDLRRKIAERNNQHVQTLLGMAQRRVRGYSRLSTGVVIVLTVSLFFGAGGFLGSFGLDPTLTAVLLMWCLTIGAAWLVACGIDNARQNLRLPATKPMRSPPAASTWMTKIKTVRSVRSLRKLQCHIPLNQPDGEI